jgi:kinesin family member 2/24
LLTQEPILQQEPLLHFFLQGGVSTIFAFGQTGSGKSFTIQGIQQYLAQDLFLMLDATTNEVTVSFFEVYNGLILDLLNQRNRLKVMEDRKKGDVFVTGLSEHVVNSADELFAVLDTGNTERTTHATEANESSSRSHALFQINLLDKRTKKGLGKLSLIDLAGSERWNDTKSHDSKRREESADINTSLLALKECIRSFSMGQPHLPYRQSKLTMILKDCFTSDRARTAMIATLAPGASAADHTVNTLRYADMTKCRKVSKSPIRTKAKEQRAQQTSTTQVNVGVPKQPNSTSQKFQKPLSSSLLAKVENGPDLRKLKERINNHHLETIQSFSAILTHEGQMVDRGTSVVTARDVNEYADELGAVLDEKEALLSKMKLLIQDYRRASEA